MAEESSSNTDVFVYTEGAIVPEDVLRVRVHPSVTIIPEEAFYKRQMLEAVELCEGLLEIGKKAFMECVVLTKITIPSSVIIIHESAFEKCSGLYNLKFFEGSLREIGDCAFNHCISLKRICLPNSIEHIGDVAFNGCPIIHFRTPSLVTTISEGLFSNCTNLFSVELPEDVTQIDFAAFCCASEEECLPLRNIAIPWDTNVG